MPKQPFWVDFPTLVSVPDRNPRSGARKQATEARRTSPVTTAERFCTYF